MTLAIGRWGLRAGLLAEAMGREAQQLSLWAGEGTRLRMEGSTFKESYEALATALKRRLAGGHDVAQEEKH